LNVENQDTSRQIAETYGQHKDPEETMPLKGHTAKVPINRINGADAEAEAHTSEAEGGNSAAKGTDATTLKMKTWAHLTLRY